MRRIIATVAVLVGVAAVTAACGGGDDSPGGGGQDVKTINVTVSGDSVTPNGDRVEVDRGQTVELVVKSDAPGEIHVHSSPEQELEYGSGTTTLTLDKIDTPGIVEVESHTLDKTIVQLEVR